MNEDAPHYFVAPSQMQSIATCRTWNLGEVPPDGRAVVVDLTKWRYVSPTPVVGLIAVLGRLMRGGRDITVIEPRAGYPLRMLETVGFVDACETFTEVTRISEPAERVRRYHPIIRAMNFKTHNEVEEIANQLIVEFGTSKQVSPPLNREAHDALAEAANNAVEHADCPEGGFALAQLRERRPASGRSWFIEIAIADAGQGIAASLGMDSDQQAIMRALDEGVSGTGDPHRGVGLAEIERLVQEPRRELAIHSGHGLVTVTPEGGRVATETASVFPGTLLTVSIPAGLS